MKLVFILCLTMIGVISAQPERRDRNHEKANMVKKLFKTGALNPHREADTAVRNRIKSVAETGEVENLLKHREKRWPPPPKITPCCHKTDHKGKHSYCCPTTLEKAKKAKIDWQKKTLTCKGKVYLDNNCCTGGCQSGTLDIHDIGHGKRKKI